MSYHIPVLLSETLDALCVRPDGIYIDGTLGGAGHAEAIATQLTTGHLYGFDQDAEAVAEATKRLSPYREHVTVTKENFAHAVTRLKEEGVTGADGILLDIGVSSRQLDDVSRGFSYRADAPLDMRMDKDSALTAKRLVNEAPEEELARILRDYGEERFAKRIAAQIVKERQKQPITSTFALNAVIADAIPKKMQQKGSHPSKRTFQALRIACNRELEVLESALGEMIDFLNPGGRLCVISFHSLEDRIVKNAFRTAESPCTCPKSFPVCVCGKTPKGKVITKRPLTATEAELKENKRAKSAKERVFEHI